MARQKIVHAGGAVVTRVREERLEVAIVHRRKYNDWSLPKGKTEPGETVPAAAVRELWEEAAARVRLGPPLDRTVYALDKDVRKHVSWWVGVPGEVRRRAPDKEIDMVSWLPVKLALKRLSYKEDRALVEQALEQPVTTPLIIVRHAKAMDRKDWSHPDQGRPLRAAGRLQSRRLVPLLAAYGVADLVSSSASRCLSTLLPYAQRYAIEPEREPKLTEEEGSNDPEAVAAVIDQVRERVVLSGRPAAVCGHRPVLPYMLAALDLPERPMATAECLVAHLTSTGEVHAVERHRALV